jgi:hypothetical protein
MMASISKNAGIWYMFSDQKVPVSAWDRPDDKKIHREKKMKIDWAYLRKG